MRCHDERRSAAALLRRLREDRDVSQQKVAEAIGRNQRFISRMETETEDVGIRVFIDVCECLGVDPVSAFGELLGVSDGVRRE